MNIILLKHGTKYNADDVNKIYIALSPYTSAKFYCFTEDKNKLHKREDGVWIMPHPDKDNEQLSSQNPYKRSQVKQEEVEEI